MPRNLKVILSRINILAFICSTFCSKKTHQCSHCTICFVTSSAARNNLFLRIKRCKRARRVHCAERTRSSSCIGGITFILYIMWFHVMISTCVHRGDTDNKPVANIYREHRQIDPSRSNADQAIPSWGSDRSEGRKTGK